MSESHLALNALAIISLVSAFAYLPMLSHDSWLRSSVKTMAVGALAIIACSLQANLLALALTLSAVGDFALSRKGTYAFLCGMIAFALAHIFYLILFFSHIAEPHNMALPHIALSVGLSLILLLSATKLGRAYASGAGELAGPVIVYVVIITLMALCALWSQWHWPLWLAVLGAFLFVISDALIGQDMFLQKHWYGQSVAIWVTYYLAQILLLAGFAWSELSLQFL